MNAKRMTVLIPFAAGVILMACQSIAQTDDRARRKFVEGLTEISLVMTHADETPEGRKLKTQIELKLRDCGLRVGSGSRRAPVMAATCETIKNPGEGYTRRLLVYLTEYAVLQRGKGTKTLFVTTWESSLNGDSYVDDDDWEKRKMEILAAVDEFINDWQAVNR